MSGSIQFSEQVNGSCCVCALVAGGGTNLQGHVSGNTVHAVCQVCWAGMMNVNNHACPLCRANITHVNGEALAPVVHLQNEGVHGWDNHHFDEDEPSMIGAFSVDEPDDVDDLSAAVLELGDDDDENPVVDLFNNDPNNGLVDVFNQAFVNNNE